MVKNINIKCDEEFLNEYKKYCKENSFNFSERLRQLMKLDMEVDALKVLKNKIKNEKKS